MDIWAAERQVQRHTFETLEAAAPLIWAPKTALVRPLYDYLAPLKGQSMGSAL